MLNPDYRDILSAFVDEKVEFLLVGAGIRIPVLSRADQATNKRAVGRPQGLVAAWLDERVDP